ncbi:MAG: hypothetical protein GC208_10345 [Alphaproteobacteria bacterium]|nr:hypothetical protein [Alphaproteobacteria bacterium]
MDFMTLLTIGGALAGFAGNAYGAWQKIRAARWEETAARKDRAISSVVAAIEVWARETGHEDRANELKKTVQLFAMGNDVESTEIAPSVADITAILSEIMASSATKEEKVKRAIKAVQDYESPDKRAVRSGAAGLATMGVFYFALLVGVLAGCTTPASTLPEARLTSESLTTGQAGQYIVVEWPATVTDPEAVRSFTQDGYVLSVAPLGTDK